ncbi:sulfoquinovose isomerase [Actinobaculum suis]|uniref:AGE family epimerase/isomerase n=1 Tax=Actinobaculum suis TaxID=1657 RepID=A0A1G6ZFP9_9ACTO|nr:AGE family epimerase/isomerase [Actinobaculum suis]MDY5153921.1 AGE family epimerase/isomerase [Actinobaculum suis]SDE01282.1 sulfoquinovose isomerase [Actinobaculum suis]
MVPTAPEISAWEKSEFRALVARAAQSRTRFGFGYLDYDGQLDPDHDLELWINCRMTHVFCLAALREQAEAEPGPHSARQLATFGIKCLREHFFDTAHGGFFSRLTAATGLPSGPGADRKEAYAHAFVLLAASSGIQAGITGAEELFALAFTAHENFFWEEQYGLVCESWDRAFTESENYRGVNANMHTLEASLAAWDATGNPRWLAKASQIINFVLGQAACTGWHIPEHFSATWQPLPDFNRDNPADPFRPYGYTPGHGVEWSRLILQFWAAVETHAQQAAALADTAGAVATSNKVAISSEAPTPSGTARSDADTGSPFGKLPARVFAQLPQLAHQLFATAIRDGWNIDGAPGFVYTIAPDRKPIVHERMHWTVCEAISAAAAFATYSETHPEMITTASAVSHVVADATSDAAPISEVAPVSEVSPISDAAPILDPAPVPEAAYFRDWHRQFIAYARTYLVHEPGLWIHELDAQNQPSRITWPGKPDVYHAAQAMLMDGLPLSPCFAGALKLTAQA